MIRLVDVFGKIDAVIFLKVKDKWYYVKDVESEAPVKTRLDEEGEAGEIRVTGEEATTFRCVGEDGQEHKIKAKSKGLVGAFQGVINAEQRTGSKQFLKLDMDSGKWWTYSISEIAREFPIWRKFLKEIPSKYIS